MMKIVNYLVGAIAFQHLCFLLLEMFFWTKPLGLKIFGQSTETAKVSATLAANQGLYNGFLAAGLIWALLQPDPSFSIQLKYFFLCCVAVAGLYGGYSFGVKILWVQMLPALIALLVLMFR